MSKPILHTVTVTGADDSIEPSRLYEIHKKYPFVEFGLLLSERHTPKGARRFPSKKWLRQLCGLETTCRLRLSGHICGDWVGGFLTGHMLDLDGIADGLEGQFNRFQINTHAEPYKHDDGLYHLMNHLDQDIIFQLDGNCGSNIASEVASNGHNIHGLFDLSHGAGVLPSEWPKQIPGVHCGYAGGLSPENVRDQLSEIEQVCNGPTWIDAETHLFRLGVFDLDRVEAFLEMAKPWVITTP